MSVKFISYDGKYPNLCRGVFVVKIDNEIWAFHSHYKQDSQYYWKGRNCLKEIKSIKHVYSVYFRSGGDCFYDDNDAYILDGNWSINFDDAKDDRGVKFYIDDSLVTELTEVFNANVEHGCCGGCL